MTRLRPSGFAGHADVLARLRTRIAVGRLNYADRLLMREAVERIEQLEREAVVRQVEIVALRAAIAPTMAREIGL